MPVGSLARSTYTPIPASHSCTLFLALSVALVFIALAMAATNIHLLVLVHGMWGNPDHLGEMNRIYEETLSETKIGPDGERLHIIVPETNKESQTYDGIDWGGERVAQEVRVVSYRIIRIGALNATLGHRGNRTSSE